MQKIACDIVYIKDISLKKHNLEKFLSFFENEKLKKIKNRQKKRHYIAGIIAGKEAIFKIFNQIFDFSSINLIDENSNHLPKIYFNNNHISLSISHVKDYAIAVAILDN
ncbi:4'-phosphopantetheinyl transferase superfamily protein [symbiont of Argiope bruennichi]|uniref:4'-phosphopantetheinyl transferase superfamily protein n=1 Tax=symbiont of Argiope bruennichi TaxID=2810479 RepID=UPI003DA5FCDF